jgi:hypothetical protein
MVQLTHHHHPRNYTMNAVIDLDAVNAELACCECESPADSDLHPMEFAEIAGILDEIIDEIYPEPAWFE